MGPGGHTARGELLKERLLRNYPVTHHQLRAKELNQTGVASQTGVFQRHQSKADEGHECDPTDEQVAPPLRRTGARPGLSSFVQSSGQKPEHLAKSWMISAHSIERTMR